MRKICARLYLFPQCAIYAHNCIYFSNAQYMCKICTRLYFFLQCAIYVQDLGKIVLISPMRKIVLISPMRNICTGFAQDCTYFLNEQNMRKICTRLYFFPQCARLYLFPQCAIYAQDMCKIVLLSPVHNICARFAQDCTFFPNAQYMRKICVRLYLFPQCTIYVQDCTYFLNAQDLCKIVLISPMRNICA